VKTYIRELIEQGDRLFSKRMSLMSLWQEIGENFYCERAQFTKETWLGEDFAANLTTSYPLLCRRELGNTFSAMLRPSDRDWFVMKVDGVTDHDGKAWLDWATKTQKRAMYHRSAQFLRATKEGDHDYAAFGQCVITVELQPDRSGLLYRCWHLRDVAWCDGYDGAVESVHHKMPMTGYTIKKTFGERGLSDRMRKLMEKDPYCEIVLRRIVVPADMYRGDEKISAPLVSIYVDPVDGFEVEVVGCRVNPYVIPRWQTVSGSQYAHSPATICALPDARLIQAMSLTLLEAGEKAVNPPMAAIQEAIRGDVSIYAGGITWLDAQHDKKIQELISPIANDKSGVAFGLEMVRDTRAMIRSGFFLDKLDLPVNGPEMTAYEVGQRVQEYIRGALPLFEPVESDYNGAICDRTFDVMMMEGAFGPPDRMPRSLSKRDMTYVFTSPLRDAIEKQKAQTFTEAGQLISQAVALDPGAGSIVDAKVALRDTLEGIGVPTKWTRSEEDVQAISDAEAQQAEQEQMLGAMQQAATVAKDLVPVAA